MHNPMFLLLVLALAGCNDPDPISARGEREAPAVDQPSAAMPAIVQPATEQSAAGQPAADPPATDQPAAAGDVATPATAAKLALDGEGLRIFTVATGSSRAIPFGIDKAEALGMLEAVQGAPPSDQGENIDCGATNAIWPDGLTVWFARDKFVGWSVASAVSPLSTVGGLKLGSTRAEVENGASVARIAPSSLGEEFTAGGVAGLLDSADADARVSNLWAGAACIAR